MSNVYRAGCELHGISYTSLERGHELYLSVKGANKFGFAI